MNESDEHVGDHLSIDNRYCRIAHSLIKLRSFTWRDIYHGDNCYLIAIFNYIAIEKSLFKNPKIFTTKYFVVTRDNGIHVIQNLWGKFQPRSFVMNGM